MMCLAAGMKKTNKHNQITTTTSDDKFITFDNRSVEDCNMGQKKRLKWWKFNWKPVHHRGVTSTPLLAFTETIITNVEHVAFST
ncbi:hypothetical protein QE152_g3459 [Popillia japonica]|uniref:Uncharacterized protein n=1 Tax=Popillia japonica TaxID=7064 RepID=A0AAW1N5T6_POPJA